MRRCGDFPCQSFLLTNTYLLVQLLGVVSYMNRKGFKCWLLTAAQQAAEATKERGFLGIGDVRVSAAEQAVLAELAGMLGVTI